jgi:hypothetical protein
VGRKLIVMLVAVLGGTVAALATAPPAAACSLSSEPSKVAPPDMVVRGVATELRAPDPDDLSLLGPAAIWQIEIAEVTYGPQDVERVEVLVPWCGGASRSHGRTQYFLSWWEGGWLALSGEIEGIPDGPWQPPEPAWRDQLTIIGRDHGDPPRPDDGGGPLALPAVGLAGIVAVTAAVSARRRHRARVGGRRRASLDTMP